MAPGMISAFAAPEPEIDLVAARHAERPGLAAAIWAPIRELFSRLGHLAVPVLLLIAGYVATRKITMVPGKAQNFFEVAISGIEEFMVDITGEHGRWFTPYAATIFLYIVTCNLIGLIPGFLPATDTLKTNLRFNPMSPDERDRFSQRMRRFAENRFQRFGAFVARIDARNRDVQWVECRVGSVSAGVERDVDRNRIGRPGVVEDRGQQRGRLGSIPADEV